MNVGVISPEFPPEIGGVETYAYEFARELAHQGHRVTVFTRQHLEGETALPGVHVVPSLKLRQSIDRALLRDTSFDVWHVMNAAYAWVALEASPVVISVHGNDFLQPYVPVAQPDLQRLPGFWRSSRLRPMMGAFLAWLVPVVVAGLGAWLLYLINLGLVFLDAPIVDSLRFVINCAALSGLISAVALRYAYVQEQWRQQVHAQAKAEVDALQARIRPHFLFNSMNTIAALTRSDAAQAERAVEDLADLFRASLAETRDVVPLSEELEIARTYERIEQLRLGSRLKLVPANSKARHSAIGAANTSSIVNWTSAALSR